MLGVLVPPALVVAGLHRACGPSQSTTPALELSQQSPGGWGAL